MCSSLYHHSAYIEIRNVPLQSSIRTTYIVIVFEEICVLWLMGNMSILARGSSFRRTWSEYSEEKFLSELRPTFVLPMKNSVTKICHTGNISKLLNGGKAIFKSQMFNLRIYDGIGGLGYLSGQRTPPTCSVGQSSRQWILSSAPLSSTPSPCAGILG